MIKVTAPPRRQKRAVPDMVRRERALQRTRKKYEGKPLVLGKRDCATMVRYHLVGMGHHNLPQMPKYSSAAGVGFAIKALGAGSLVELFDGLLERIAPAAMLPGDVGLIPGAFEEGGETILAPTLVISLGRKFWSWAQDGGGMAVMEPVVESPFLAAWRA